MVMKYRLTSEPLIFLYTVIFTINYTVLPQLVVKKICLVNGNNATLYEDEDFISKDIELKKEATSWWFYLLLASLLPSVFTVLIWGPITDVIGRRRAMIFVPLINATRSCVYLINSYFMESNVAYLLFGSILSCFYGEFQGVAALCYAYLADITSTDLDQRTMRMAFIEASLFFAGIPAGLLSGFLLQHLGYVYVFGLNIGINICILIYVIFYLPTNEAISTFSSKSIGDEDGHQRKMQGATITSCSNLFNPIAHLQHVFHVVTSHSCRAVVIPIILSFGFSVCAVYGELVVQTLYLQNQPFVFTAQYIGYYSAVQSFIRGFGVILLTQWSYHSARLSDHVLVLIGLISQIVCYISIGIVRKLIPVFLVNLTGFGIPVATTTLRSLATKNVKPEDYGAVLSSLEAMDVIAGVLTNAATLWTYNLTLYFYSGIAYITLAGFACIAVLFLWIGYRLTKYELRNLRDYDTVSD